MSAGRTPLIVVLGGGGRLGTTLLPHLLDTAELVVVVGRKQPAHAIPGARWQLLDATDQQQVDLATRSLAEMSTACTDVVVIDLLLDRSTVTAMRGSIEAASHFTDLLRERASEHGRTLSLVAASTTAVLAPWCLQTPYGLAKRRQLRHYTASGLPGAALLLPQLVPTAQDADESALRWTFDYAARRMVEAIHCHATHHTFTIYIPHESASPVQAPARQVFRCAWHTVQWWTRRLTQPDSPHAHRQASRGLLTLIPPSLRQDIDHHRAPAALVRKLASGGDAHVQRMTP